MPSEEANESISFISLFEQWEAKRSSYQYRCAAILLNILSALSTERIGKADGKAAIIMRGAELISSDFQSPELTVEAAAAASSVSPEYFRAIYKEVYGITPHRAIEEKRLEKACRLLETGDFKVARVAKECGFSDAKYFSTLFRARLGVSPRAYKKKLDP